MACAISSTGQVWSSLPVEAESALVLDPHRKSLQANTHDMVSMVSQAEGSSCRDVLVGVWYWQQYLHALAQLL